ncbi:MAG: hypothetical protein J6W75_06495 [Bacteroidaceae bacterium]|nr:hypothetical protein [Bacteroidaceae bacterium]
MKSAYITPTIEVRSILASQILCTSESQSTGGPTSNFMSNPTIDIDANVSPFNCAVPVDWDEE